jgi:hypothetical protein
VAVLLAQPGPDPGAALWAWLWRTEVAATARASAASAPAASAFDEALAAALLDPAGHDASASMDAAQRVQRRLLATLTAPAPAHAGAALPTIPPLAALQRSLPADTLFLAVLDAAPRPVRLAVSRERVEVQALPVDGPELRRRVDALGQAVAGFGAVAEIDDAGRDLGAILFDGLAARAPPANVWLLAQEPLSRVPWGVLHWPGAAEPMVAHTAVNLVVPVVPSAAPAVTGPREVFALAADAALPNGAPLTATAEARAVATLLPAPAFAVRTLPGATRSVLLDALGTPGAWLHVAAHGVSRAQFIGRSGLWLARPDGTGGDFVGTFEVDLAPVRTDLVVLNACQLGASAGDALGASAGFAEALVRDGARDVVAALWPVSDAAAYRWAQAFYSDLPADAGSGAIAQAQRRAAAGLREQRLFRHPAYWAAQTHFSRMDLSPMRDAVAPPR